MGINKYFISIEIWFTEKSLISRDKMQECQSMNQQYSNNPILNQCRVSSPLTPLDN